MSAFDSDVDLVLALAAMSQEDRAQFEEIRALMVRLCIAGLKDGMTGNDLRRLVDYMIHGRL